MSGFEEHLLGELRAVHGADAARLPTRRRPRPTRVLAAGAGVIVAAVVAVAATLALTATPATTKSYSIIRNPDGSLTVTLNAIHQMKKLNDVFESMGVHARAVPVTKKCQPVPGDILNVWPGHTMNDTIVLGTRNLPGEGPERIGAAELPNGQVELDIVTVVNGPVPTCFAK